MFKEILIEKENDLRDELLYELGNCNNSYLHDAHKRSKVKLLRRENKSSVHMEKENSEFENYKNSLIGHSLDSPESVYQKYQKERNTITSDMYMSEHQRWKALTDDANSKNLWHSINWKGNLSKCSNNTENPTVDVLALHFKCLYKPNDADEASKISNLTMDSYIPFLDDPDRVR